jgi:hypothetical protein
VRCVVLVAVLVARRVLVLVLGIQVRLLLIKLLLLLLLLGRAVPLLWKRARDAHSERTHTHVDVLRRGGHGNGSACQAIEHCVRLQNSGAQASNVSSHLDGHAAGGLGSKADEFAGPGLWFGGLRSTAAALLWRLLLLLRPPHAVMRTQDAVDRADCCLQRCHARTVLRLRAHERQQRPARMLLQVCAAAHVLAGAVASASVLRRRHHGGFGC